MITPIRARRSHKYPTYRRSKWKAKWNEEDRGRIAISDAVVVHVDAFPEQTLEGKLNSISLLAETSFEEWPPMRTFRAFAALKKTDPRMRPGMNAGADIVQQKLPGAISIPARTLFTVHGKPTVYFRHCGRAGRHSVLAGDSRSRQHPRIPTSCGSGTAILHDKLALDLGALSRLDIFQSETQLAERGRDLVQAQYEYKVCWTDCAG